MADFFAGHAKTYAAIFRNEAGSKACSSIKNEGKRLVGAIYQVPGHIGNPSQVTLHTVGTIHEAYHRLAVLAPFQPEDMPYCLLVGSVTTDAPNGISGIQDETTRAQGLNGCPYVFCYFFLCQGNYRSYGLELTREMELYVLEVLLCHLKDVA